MKRFLFFLYIVLLAVVPVTAQQVEGAAAPTREFLLGKTHFEKDTNFVEIAPAYTVLRRPNNFIQKRTLEAFLKMREAALQDGVKLTATSASRNFWVQRYIWEQKWQKSSVAKGVDRARSILCYNSMCGTSRHHWGTDLDFNSPKLEYWNSEEGRRTYEWLCGNAHKFGFYQPYTEKGEPGSGKRTTGYNEEKWHWSYYPLANIYMKYYRELITEKDLGGFLGQEFVPGLEVIDNYVFGVATPPSI